MLRNNLGTNSIARLVIIVSVTILLGAQIGCDKGKGRNGGKGGKGSMAGTGSEPQPLAMLERNRIPVQTAKIVRRNVQNSYRASAVLQADRDVQILVNEEGTISKVNYLAGDKVATGDVIATIAAPILKSRLNKAKIAYSDKQRLFRASDSLFKKKHIARDRFEEARIALETAKIAYEDAKRSIGDLTLKAPFDGLVVHNHLQIGAHTTSYRNDPPIRVVSDDKLKSTFSIPVLHISSIVKDMNLSLHTRGVSGTASVTRIAPIVDKDTGTVLVYFAVDNQNHLFMSGERVSLEVPLGDASERLILPENSVIFEGDKPYVYIARDPSKDEIKSDLAQFLGGADNKGGPKSKKGGKGSPDNKEASEAVKGDEAKTDTADMSEEEKKKALDKAEEEANLKKALAAVPRAQKVPVNLEQMANGEYALQGIQEGLSKSLTEGSEVVVIGLYHMADDAKLKLLDNL